ncbi:MULTISPECIES: YpjP family protein [Pontibacillus]|uniref:YpjP family protein n=1 Tax=Pontibacillus chungwhensis TaxID=265426 RepID=A0ABY8V0B4_9BACI|nr:MULTISPECIES: YpjP family protein [Pontibacillus]MCD5325064.1 YpjP family protein [Pontibacillus sp. HN14]WIF97316.1 YpjP family protein [Pontibacillus chungwhensis]
MKRWVRKTFTILTAIVTLGLYVPPTTLDADTTEKNKTFTPKENIEENKASSIHSANSDHFLDLPDLSDDDHHLDPEQHLTNLGEVAKEQTMTKLGSRILGQIDPVFMDDILVTIESEVKQLVEQADESNVLQYDISLDPAPGYGEKIFHVYNTLSNAELARFDVRRENRPGEGYWFNFHYHVSQDQFENHHAVADLYWDKNTPPKWMA